jgi:hypothetical protein
VSNGGNLGNPVVQILAAVAVIASALSGSQFYANSDKVSPSQASDLAELHAAQLQANVDHWRHEFSEKKDQHRECLRTLRELRQRLSSSSGASYYGMPDVGAPPEFYPAGEAEEE